MSRLRLQMGNEMKKKSGKNVYEKKITLGRDASGTPIRKSITGRTMSELNDRIESAKQEWARMHDVTDGVLFSTYARKWLTSAKAVRSLNTRLMYQNAIEKHIIPEIGDYYFSEITLSDLQTIINNRSDKYETCNKIKLTLKQIYGAAADDGIKVDFKVSKLALPPKKQSEKRALTAAEKEALFKAPLPPIQRLYVLMLYYTGLRREEALALTVGDIDTVKNVVCVRRTVIFDGNRPVIKDSAKTSASRRDVPIPAAFRNELYSYMQDKRILFPMSTRPNEYMSLSSYVKFWNGIIRALVPFAESAKDLTAHIFRHNYATILYYSGISPKMAAKLMGHSNTQMIMQIYAHLDDEQEKTSDKLDAAFA